MIKIDLAGASAMNESYSVIENQGYVAAFVDRTILKNVSGPRDDALKEIVFKVDYSGCVFLSSHAEFGQNDPRKTHPHLIRKQYEGD